MRDGHNGNLRPGDWYACDFPERPAADETWYEATCRSCILALGADARLTPNLDLLSDLTGVTYTLAEGYERLRHDFGFPSLSAAVPCTESMP